MIQNPVILCTFLILGITKIQSDSPAKEDFQDEYYTIAATNFDKIQPSDDRDAQAVLDSCKDRKVLASIFVYRDKPRRNAISEAIRAKNEKIVEQTQGRHARNRRRSWWISETYTPQISETFMDLIFTLIFDEKVVLAAYLYGFFREKLQKRITIAMVLTKDMHGMIETYNRINWGNFKDARKNQDEPYENMLRVWVRHNRDQLEKDDPAPDAIRQNAEALKKEQDAGGWRENRDQIELITMKKSIKFAREVILAFEKLNDGKHLEDILTDNVKSCGLNENLADTYGSLARYIKNKHKYVAQILAKAEYTNGSDYWAIWMLCIAAVHPQEWPKVDEAFNKDQKGVSLSKFITEKISGDKILAEALALTVDSKYKPTSFSEKPMDNSPLPPPPPPPVPPTTPAPP